MVKDLKILALPLAERLKWYARRDAIEAAEGKVVQLSPATDQATAGCALSVPSSLPSAAMPRATTAEDDPFALSVPSSLPSAVMPRATTAEDDPFGPSWT